MECALKQLLDIYCEFTHQQREEYESKAEHITDPDERLAIAIEVMG